MQVRVYWTHNREQKTGSFAFSSVRISRLRSLNLVWMKPKWRVGSQMYLTKLFTRCPRSSGGILGRLGEIQEDWQLSLDQSIGTECPPISTNKSWLISSGRFCNAKYLRIYTMYCLVEHWGKFVNKYWCVLLVWLDTKERFLKTF